MQCYLFILILGLVAAEQGAVSVETVPKDIIPNDDHLIGPEGYYIMPEGVTDPCNCARRKINPMWIDQSGKLLTGMANKWRKDDIVISVPPKSGTTWTMNIVHQLRTGGDENLQDIYSEVPWLEFLETPYIRHDELYTRWQNLPWWYPRAFKTHQPPPTTPFSKHVRYVVVMRDPRDALASIVPFFNAVTQDIMSLFDISQEMQRDVFRSNSVKPIFNGMLQKGRVFTGFLQGWWPHRLEPNVLMLHYADMKKDHAGTIKKIHDFLGLKLTDAQLSNVARLTSFQYMKAHGEKYTLQNLQVKILPKDGMVRKGGIGDHATELPEEDIDEFMEVAEKELSAPQLKWMLEGGELPGPEHGEL